MAICERVVFAHFAQYVGSSHVCSDERLFKLEHFFFDALRDIDLWDGLVSRQKVLSCQICWLRHANKRKDALQAVINLGLEALFSVLDDVELWMPDPCLNQTPVDLSSLLNRSLSR